VFVAVGASGAIGSVPRDKARPDVAGCVCVCVCVLK